MKKGLSDEVIKRIELLEGMDIANALERRYFFEKLSYRKLMSLWGINNRTVAKIIAHCNKEPRRGGEAVKTQWINNESRRKLSAEIISKTNHNLALKGLHIRQGKTKENSELIRSISEKLKTSTSFHRKEVREKAVRNATKTRKAYPERNPFLKTSETKSESIIRMFLEKHNIEYKFRHIINGYFFNFYLPKHNLLIDIQGSNRFPLSFERHKTVLQEGYRITYCIRYFIEKSDLSNLYEYISNLNIISRNPTFRSQESVIWGARQIFPFGKENNKVIVKITRDNITHKTHITAPSN